MNEVLFKLQDFITRIESLTIYRKIRKDPVIASMYKMAQAIVNESDISESKINHSKFIENLLIKVEKLGFNGNVFAKYVVYLFLNDENIFSKNCEIKSIKDNATINYLARHEFDIMEFMISIDLDKLNKYVGFECDLNNYVPIKTSEHDEINQFINSGSNNFMFSQIVYYYQNIGCGNISKYKLLRYSEETNSLNKLEENSNLKISDIIGYESQKKELMQNFESFLKGETYKNLFLIGGIGTGKSTYLKALVNQNYGRGLRLVVVNRHDIKNLIKIVDIVKNRGKKIIIYISGGLSENNTLEREILKDAIEYVTEGKQKDIIFCASHNCEDKAMEILFDGTLKFEFLDFEGFFKIAMSIVAKEKLKIKEDFLKEYAQNYAANIENLTGKDAVKFINVIKSEISS